MLLPAGVVEHHDHAVADAAGGERGEGGTAGPPRAHGAQQADARLLDDVFAVDALRQAHRSQRRVHQRLVAAQQLGLGALVVALRRRQQRAFGTREAQAPGSKAGHARARCARR